MASLKGFSELQLILTLHDLAKTDFDDKLESDLILLDLSKSIDSVSHQRLLLKLQCFLSAYGVIFWPGLCLYFQIDRSWQVSVWGMQSKRRAWRTSRISSGTPSLPYIHKSPSQKSLIYFCFADNEGTITFILAINTIQSKCFTILQTYGNPINFF